MEDEELEEGTSQPAAASVRTAWWVGREEGGQRGCGSVGGGVVGGSLSEGGGVGGDGGKRSKSVRVRDIVVARSVVEGVGLAVRRIVDGGGSWREDERRAL